ncbi:MAG TPA: helix-turn-helix domain-containing protein [archaeon]|nr:helix-turn-helix domain-containing protein [archaeon]
MKEVRETVPEYMTEFFRHERYGDIVIALYRGEIRFSKIKRMLKPISSKTLSVDLKGLQRMELIGRNVISDRPLRTEYGLTEMGQSFYREVVEPLRNWQNKWNGSKRQEPNQ